MTCIAQHLVTPVGKNQRDVVTCSLNDGHQPPHTATIKRCSACEAGSPHDICNTDNFTVTWNDE